MRRAQTGWAALLLGVSRCSGDRRAARWGALAPLLAIVSVVAVVGGCPAEDDSGKGPDVYQPTTMAPPNESATAASPIDDDAGDEDDDGSPSDEDDGSSSGEASDASSETTASAAPSPVSLRR